MADIFNQLNFLNMHLQYQTQTYFMVMIKLGHLWTSWNYLFYKYLFKRDHSAFLHTYYIHTKFCEENELQLNSNVITDISEHIQSLKSYISKYFSKDNELNH